MSREALEAIILNELNLAEQEQPMDENARLKRAIDIALALLGQPLAKP